MSSTLKRRVPVHPLVLTPLIRLTISRARPPLATSPATGCPRQHGLAPGPWPRLGGSSRLPAFPRQPKDQVTWDVDSLRHLDTPLRKLHTRQAFRSLGVRGACGDLTVSPAVWASALAREHTEAACFSVTTCDGWPALGPRPCPGLGAGSSMRPTKTQNEIVSWGLSPARTPSLLPEADRGAWGAGFLPGLPGPSPCLPPSGVSPGVSPASRAPCCPWLLEVMSLLPGRLDGCGRRTGESRGGQGSRGQLACCPSEV